MLKTSDGYSVGGIARGVRLCYTSNSKRSQFNLSKGKI